MKRFTKKLLAKYVQYIEIIGYFFVLLFIAGLIALSFIKAEDEFVQLTGEMRIQTFIPEITLPQYFIKSRVDSVSVVQTGDTLFIISDHQPMLQDQLLLQNLTQQAATIQAESDKEILLKLNEIIQKIRAKKYPEAINRLYLSPIAGEFFNFINSAPQLVAQPPVGGVFDFENARIQVTQFPTDRQMVKKLKIGQTGTAHLSLSQANSIPIPVTLIEIDQKQASFQMNPIPLGDRKKLAAELCKTPQPPNLSANISVLVGWKSWMRLIWR